jgi:hypothetical protein
MYKEVETKQLCLGSLTPLGFTNFSQTPQITDNQNKSRQQPLFRNANMQMNNQKLPLTFQTNKQSLPSMGKLPSVIQEAPEKN